MTVVDSSGVVEYVLGSEPGALVAKLVAPDGELAAPDVLVFEVLAVLRRMVMRGLITSSRAGEAVSDLADAPISLFPSMQLRSRAWELRDNLTIGDGLFVALAEQLSEPLATRDLRLAAAVSGLDELDVELTTLP